MHRIEVLGTSNLYVAPCVPHCIQNEFREEFDRSMDSAPPSVLQLEDATYETYIFLKFYY